MAIINITPKFTGNNYTITDQYNILYTVNNLNFSKALANIGTSFQAVDYILDINPGMIIDHVQLTYATGSMCTFSFKFYTIHKGILTHATRPPNPSQSWKTQYATYYPSINDIVTKIELYAPDVDKKTGYHDFFLASIILYGPEDYVPKPDYYSIYQNANNLYSY